MFSLSCCIKNSTLFLLHYSSFVQSLKRGSSWIFNARATSDSSWDISFFLPNFLMTNATKKKKWTEENDIHCISEDEPFDFVTIIFRINIYSPLFTLCWSSVLRYSLHCLHKLNYKEKSRGEGRSLNKTIKKEKYESW